MKLSLIRNAVVAGLCLAFTSSSWALPPRQHSVSGVIAKLDWSRREITLKSAGDAPGMLLAWNDRTRFTKPAGCVQCSLAVGRQVGIYYRRELGQNMLREVSSKGGTCKQGQP